jgi:hypothetical protein
MTDTETGWKLVKFERNCGRMGSLEGLFVCDPDEWKTLQLLIKHEINIDFGEALGKHSQVDGPLLASEITVRSENTEFCKEFRRLDLDTGYSPIGTFDPALFWEQSYDQTTKKGKDWPPNEDGTFNWVENG